METKKIFITRAIPEAGLDLLKREKYEITVSPHDRVLRKEELLDFLKKDKYDAVLCLLTDHIDSDVYDAAGRQCKVFANYAVGFDNIDLKTARERNILITNTPGVLTETVAEHTFALMLAISRRIAEADRFTKAGKYKGWAPMLLLGNDLSGKTLGVIGSGRIGSRVARHAVKGFNMKVIYFDVNQNKEFEKEYGAVYKDSVEEVLKDADFVTLHVPLIPATRHLINEGRLNLMKNSAYLINTSRGPVVDENAITYALRNNIIKGAALDVFEREPDISDDLMKLENVILTPHIASGTEETRSKMAEIAAKNIIEVLMGRVPPNIVQVS